MATKKKMQATYKGKSTRPGGGGRFARRVDQLVAAGMSREGARGEAAKEGRAEYGKKKFQRMASAGKKSAARKRKAAAK